MTDNKTLKQRIDAILGRNCPALGGVSAEGISVIRELEQRQAELVKALEKAVADYGKPGGPWNVPGEPGTWISMARAALAKAKGGV